jgi:HEAT repeat protein
MRPEPAPRTSSAGAWLAIVTLVFAAAAFALLVERITVLETTMVREDRALAGDLRDVLGDVDATLASVGDQGRELEFRLADRLDASREQADTVIRELSAELADSRREVARLSETIERQTTELAQTRADAVRRHDDLTGRLARSEEDLRYYSQRLSDLEMASLRPITAAADGVPTAGAPAWHGLLTDLASPLAGTRWQAVDALGQTGDLAVVEHLVPVLKDPDVFVRMAGARALEALGAVEATPALIDALEDPEAAVREAAIVALKKLTGRDFRFDPLGNDSERAKRVKAWRDWWEKEGGGEE